MLIRCIPLQCQSLASPNHSGASTCLSFAALCDAIPMPSQSMLRQCHSSHFFSIATLICAFPSHLSSFQCISMLFHSLADLFNSYAWLFSAMPLLVVADPLRFGHCFAISTLIISLAKHGYSLPSQFVGLLFLCDFFPGESSVSGISPLSDPVQFAEVKPLTDKGFIVIVQ